MSSPDSSLPPDALSASTKLFGSLYEVDSLLGRGGFGLTYLCAEPALLRWVAIKELFPPGATRQDKQVLPPHGVSLADWDKAKRAFVSEARRLASFADPSIVRVFGVWEENNTAYMAMEALDGGSLAARLRVNGALSPTRVAELGLSLCRTLSVLHGANLLHRDLKPDNIFFAPDDSPILIDFGNARNLVAQQTHTVSLSLTPGYAPPEAYSSQSALTPASDIYSLGATLWECLTGSPPPDATDRTLGAPLPTLLDQLPNCPPILAHCLEQSLQLKPDARFPNASAMAVQLGVALEATRQFGVKPIFDPAPAPQTPAPSAAPPLTIQPGLTPCAHCSQMVSVEESICPHCGHFRNGYVPGQHMRHPLASRSLLSAMWVVTFAIFAILTVSTLSRVSRRTGIYGGSTTTRSASRDNYTDSPAKLRVQSTQLRRDLSNTEWVDSVRPQFGAGSIDIVASSTWQKLGRDDKLNAARDWADRWKDARAPLPAPFQITDAKGRVLGGRTTGALTPWIQN